MLTLKLSKLRISLTFGFFFVLALMTLRDNRLGGFSMLFCVAHELGHLAVMRIFDVGVSEVTFYGAGIKISAKSLEDIPAHCRALIYLAGPITNIFFAAILSGDLAALNLSFAAFNLLPISYFDGGKLASMIIKSRGAIVLMSVLSYLLLAFAAAVAICHDTASLNPSALITLVFIVLANILDG